MSQGCCKITFSNFSEYFGFRKYIFWMRNSIFFPARVFHREKNYRNPLFRRVNKTNYIFIQVTFYFTERNGDGPAKNR